MIKVAGLIELANPLIFAELGVQVHVNKVPVTFEVNEILVLLLLQISLVSRTLLRLGVGKTVTTKSTESPGHPCATGNSRYVTVCGTNPLFSNRWLISTTGTELFKYPVTRGEEPKALHVN